MTSSHTKVEDGNQDPVSLLLVTAFLQQCEAAFKMFMVKGLGQYKDPNDALTVMSTSK